MKVEDELLGLGKGTQGMEWGERRGQDGTEKKGTYRMHVWRCHSETH